MDYLKSCDYFSVPRMEHYRNAVGESKAVVLYRLNLQLSQELFSLVSVFEIILRNKINDKIISETGDDTWLLNSIQPNTEGVLPYKGCFLTPKTREAANIIWGAVFKLGAEAHNHNHLLAELGFGFWRYLFADGQYDALGKVLLDIFPSKPAPVSTTDKFGKTVWVHYNQKWVLNQLAQINIMRNRLAHHEPVCFQGNVKSTIYARQIIQLIVDLLSYMNIDTAMLLTDLNNRALAVCDEIDKL